MSNEICVSCGGTKTWEEMKAGGFLSCCPERKVINKLEMFSIIQEMGDELYHYSNVTDNPFECRRLEELLQKAKDAGLWRDE